MVGIIFSHIKLPCGKQFVNMFFGQFVGCLFILLILLSVVHARRSHDNHFIKTIDYLFCKQELCARCSMMSIFGDFHYSGTLRMCKFILSRSRCCPISNILFLAWIKWQSFNNIKLHNDDEGILTFHPMSRCLQYKIKYVQGLIL